MRVDPRVPPGPVFGAWFRRWCSPAASDSWRMSWRKEGTYRGFLSTRTSYVRSSEADSDSSNLQTKQIFVKNYCLTSETLTIETALHSLSQAKVMFGLETIRRNYSNEELASVQHGLRNHFSESLCDFWTLCFYVPPTGSRSDPVTNCRKRRCSSAVYEHRISERSTYLPRAAEATL